MIERIAHRGNSYAARENTPAAFVAAVEAGCEFVELDVRRTADGGCVVLHDATLTRLWGVPRAVAEMASAEVAEVGIGEVRVPTLAEVLERLAGTGVGVLIDATNVPDVEAAVAAVRGLAAARLPEIQWCGATDAMLAVRRALPDAVIRYAASEPISDAGLAELAPAYWNYEWTELTREQVEADHRAGRKVACWTPDGAAELRHCLALGVDAITTNRLRRLTALLDAAGAPTPGTAPGAIGPLAPADIERAYQVAVELADAVVRYTRDAPIQTSTAKASAADFVTNVDLGVERLVRETIAAAFPDHVVVGEEFGGEPQPGTPTWYVDPVDGTTNLGNGIPWTSLSLALAVDDEPVLGVVAQPWTGEVASAIAGGGAWLDGLPVARPSVDSLAGTTVGLELAAQHWWDGMNDVVVALAAADATARVMGSGTLTVTQPGLGRGAAGTVHLFNPIDHLAGVIIARAAGCRILDRDGDAPAFPRRERGILVAAPGVAEELAALWRPHAPA